MAAANLKAALTGTTLSYEAARAAFKTVAAAPGMCASGWLYRDIVMGWGWCRDGSILAREFVDMGEAARYRQGVERVRP